MHKNALIIFAKLPVEGRVKTRLAEDIGAADALEFYNACSHYIFEQAARLIESECDVWLFYGINDDFEKIKSWVQYDFNFVRQSDGDLGVKMKSAFEFLFRKRYEKAVIIGTDIPDINASLIVNAFKELDNFDVVIGPSNDGGYYLLGMKELKEYLFNDVKWSSSEVYEKTIQLLKANGDNYISFEELIDVDDLKSLKKWLDEDGTNKLKNKIKLIVKNES